MQQFRALVAGGLLLVVGMGCATTQRIKVESDVVGARAGLELIDRKGKTKQTRIEPTPAEFKVTYRKGRKGATGRGLMIAGAIFGGMALGFGVSAGVAGDDGSFDQLAAVAAAGVTGALGLILAVSGFVVHVTDSGFEGPQEVVVHVDAPGRPSVDRVLVLPNSGNRHGPEVIKLNP
ncbi:MAG: hypothetical protein ACFB9M_20220 [Myxococcota bacterium]